MLDRDTLLELYRIDDRREGRVRVNFVSSIDGAITRDGSSSGLNNEADKAVFDTLRALCDVIVVGAGTVRAEGYGGVRVSDADAEWRIRHGLAPQPRVAIVSSSLDIEPTHAAFARAPVRAMVITHASAPADRRAALGDVADVLECGVDGIDMAARVEKLALAGHPQILCEGGPRLIGALIEADRIDEMCVTVSPVLEGGDAGRMSRGAALASREMRLDHAVADGDTVFLRYSRAR